MKAIKKALTTAGIALLSVMMLLALVGCDSEEMKSAASNKGANKSPLRKVILSSSCSCWALWAASARASAEISTAQELAATDEIPLDDSLKPALEDAISTAKTIKFEKPAMPSDMDEIIAATEGLKDEGYDDEVQVLKDAETALSNSIEQRRLVTAPSEAFVIERLQGVPLVDQSRVIGSNLAERGIDAGGSIEVFETEEAAKKRCDYIATYDGTFMKAGTHAVIGTVLVRTSDELTASQQKQLEANIIAALTRL